MSKKQKTKVKIFSALEVANICGVVNQTAINWIRNGYLKAFSTPGGQYRVYAEDLLAFLKSRGMRVADEVLEMLAERLERKTLVVLDRDQDRSDTLKNLVETRFPHFTVIQAFDCFDAGRKFSEAKPGIVLLGTDLPDINTRDIARKIKNDPGLGRPRVIAFTDGTALSPEAKPEENPDAGWADALLTKPVDVDMLFRVIESLEQHSSSAPIAELCRLRPFTP
jgi:excisionase family DNA binding protein